ncbi:T9SS C-terminal target domain-containing protein [Rhodohalobacter sp. SW132]|uniref:S8 family peptidase n=1 Tax=Rhodohalobacter sp. SW132 TaxID=2293433 RepID=UPI000E23C18F|nr:S8 family peptidase [Rhodohalobacter sp. SW132]REL38472.1 T9SS C-terminal target domain-containing protein [Rhodohalobacter sp. SW132]
MKKLPLLIIIFFIPGLIYAQIPGVDYHPERVIIKFSDNAQVLHQLDSYLAKSDFNYSKINSSDQAIHSIASDFFSNYGFLSLRKLKTGFQSARKKQITNHPFNRIYIAELPAGRDVLSVIDQLNNDPAVEIAEPDFIGHGGGKRAELLPFYLSEDDPYPNDNFFEYQWGLENRGQAINQIQGVSGEDINIKPAWHLTTGSRDITIAILDSGQPDSVPDFSGRVVPGYNFAYDTTSTIDDHGHGTNVASIAVATGNNGGIIAGGDWQSNIMPVKILDDENSGFYSWWIDGIYWAVENGADILNMSVGGSQVSQLMEEAVEWAIGEGVHVIACTMNTNDDVMYYPAGYDGVISVGAINNEGNRAAPFCWSEDSGSNYGEHIDLVAPGEFVLGLSHSNPEGASYWCGTSQAAPMVAGVVGLMLSVNPSLTPAEVKNILITQARGDNSWNRYTGWGTLDAYASVTSIITSREEELKNETPSSLQLDQNYPNPFNPSTQIRYSIPERDHITLTIYSLDGRKVTVLYDGVQNAGSHSITFDAAMLASGIYLYKLEAGGMQTSRMMTMIK